LKFVCLVAVIIVSAGGVAISGEPWEMIDWNSPVPMYERVMGDWYILPSGWQEAIEAEGTKSITFINSGSMSGDPAMELNILYFEKLTGIDIIYEEVGEDDINPKQVATLTGRLPHYDLIFLTTFSEPLVDYALQGWVMPIDILWDDQIASVYSDEMVDTLVMDGHVYAFPYIGWTPKLHYRDDLLKEAGFDRPPESWDELVEYAQKLTVDINGDGQVDRWGFGFHAGDRYSTMMTFGQLIVSQGGSLLKDGKVAVNTHEALEALRFLVDLRNRYGVVPPGVNTYGYIQVPELFAAGKLAMAMGPNWAYLVIRGSEVYPQYRMAHFPLKDPVGGVDPAASFFDFSFYGVSQFSEHKAAALLFLDFLRSYQARHTETYVERNVVPNVLVWSAPEVDFTVPWASLLRESTSQATFWAYENATQVVDIIHEEIGYALLGQKTPEQALRDAQARIDRL